MTAGVDRDSAVLRAEIVALRADLAVTVGALAQRADIKARVEHRAIEKVRAWCESTEPLRRTVDSGLAALQSAGATKARHAASRASALPNVASALATGMLVLKVVRKVKKLKKRR